MDRLVLEQALRMRDPLYLYEPMPEQKRFHESMARERLIYGSMRCLAGEQRVYDPVVGELVRVDRVESGFHVRAMNPHMGEFEVKRASRPFVKGIEDLWVYRLSNGSEIRTTPRHRVVAADGRWIQMGQAFLLGVAVLSACGRQQEFSRALLSSSLGTCRSVHDEGAQNSPRTVAGSPGDCRRVVRFCDARPLWVEDVGQSSSPSQACALVHSPQNSPQGATGSGQECIPSCPQCARLSRLRGAVASERHASFDAECRSDSRWRLGRHRLCGSDGTSRRVTRLRQHTFSAEPQHRCRDEDFAFLSSHPSRFKVATDTATATIVSAEFLRQGEVWDFSVEDWANYECAGLVNANSGKTMAAQIELSRAVRGLDPKRRYPEKDGLAFVIGRKETHTARLWQGLSTRRRSLDMIPDEKTTLWRAFRPWYRNDVVRQALVRKAEPLIPDRIIKTISWANKAAGVPKKVCLVNGWEIEFFTGNSEPERSAAIDICHIDEELDSEEWFYELASRLMEKNGWLLWSAAAQSKCVTLWNLHMRAKAQENDEKPLTQEFQLHAQNNRFLSEEGLENYKQKLSDNERVFGIRFDGEFAMHGMLVYPEFDEKLHGCAWFPIPDEWTRYVFVDPGRQVCAALFFAVPNPEKDDHIYLYDELYLKNCSAELFGQEMKKKCAGQEFEAFVIDLHGGGVHEMGSGVRVMDQFAKRLQEHGVKSRRTGHNFHVGNDDVDGGVLAVRSWLAVRPVQKTPALRVFTEKCPAFVWEIKRYPYHVNADGTVTDKVDNRRNNHAMDCLRYGALYKMRHERHEKRLVTRNQALEGWEQMKRMHAGGESYDRTIYLGVGID